MHSSTNFSMESAGVNEVACVNATKSAGVVTATATKLSLKEGRCWHGYGVGLSGVEFKIPEAGMGRSIASK